MRVEGGVGPGGWEPTTQLIVSKAALLGALSGNIFTRSNVSGSSGRHSEAPCQITVRSNCAERGGGGNETNNAWGGGGQGQRQQDGGTEREWEKERKLGGVRLKPQLQSTPTPHYQPLLAPTIVHPCVLGGSGNRWLHVNHVWQAAQKGTPWVPWCNLCTPQHTHRGICPPSPPKHGKYRGMFQGGAPGSVLQSTFQNKSPAKNTYELSILCGAAIFDFTDDQYPHI